MQRSYPVPEGNPSVRIAAAKAPALKAVLHALGNTVVAGRHDSVVQHSDGPDSIPGAVRLCADSKRDSHVVRVSVRELLESMRGQDRWAVVPSRHVSRPPFPTLDSRQPSPPRCSRIGLVPSDVIDQPEMR